VRADGRLQLHFHAEITTEDGKKIAFFADGVLTPKSGSPIAQLRLNITLTTCAAEYSWVNPIQVWAPEPSISRTVRSGSKRTPSDRWVVDCNGFDGDPSRSLPRRTRPAA
jgi:hypothetical protein